VKALGKLPAREDSIRLKFSSIFRASKLPKPPPVFGHYQTVSSWGMFSNDKVGDCVWAGAAHEHKLWNLASRRGSVPFTDASVISDYSAVTGYRGTPDTDQGTDMQEAASYRRKTGVVDAHGVRHQILAYMSLTPGDFDQLMLATWLFGAVGVGINFPDSAESQFDSHQPWTPVPSSHVSGGHYIPIVGRNSRGMAILVTWGRVHAMSREFYQLYNDETVAYFSPEYVNANNLSPEGFDAEALGNFLKELA